MLSISTENLDHRSLNAAIREAKGGCQIEGCLGERFIGAGMSEKNIVIQGVPGNALGAYLNGANITVYGNTQDAVGDTMNAGMIVVHGSLGDAAGYAMRGGKIFAAGNAGYRAGIHMKAYQDKVPLLVIGGRAGSFLGEYQAGGVIVVLNLYEPEKKIVGYFPCTGMHGGKMFLRSRCEDVTFPAQVNVREATEEDLAELSLYVEDFCRLFGKDMHEVMDAPFTVVTPDSKNPYRQMYVAN